MLMRNTWSGLLPQPQAAVLKQREEVRQKTREIFSKHSNRSNQSDRKVSTAIFTATSRTNNFFKPQSQQGQYPRKYQEQEFRPESVLRPFTQSSGSRCHRARSPLSVIRTKSREASHHSQLQTPLNLRKQTFLRRGSSIDKAIIQNVLKSKLNQNPCPPGFSYSDHECNKELIPIIASQIPRGLRDVVGVEEMMRMSHIFTGTQFKSLNLNKKLKSTLQESKLVHHHQQQDALTLKSIKRW